MERINIHINGRKERKGREERAENRQEVTQLMDWKSWKSQLIEQEYKELMGNAKNPGNDQKRGSQQQRNQRKNSAW